MIEPFQYLTKKCFKKIDKYCIENFNSKRTINIHKDFYNLVDMTITCGKCDKKMSSFRGLFHWHLFN